jgi:CheY-like chemotaxis protein
MSPGEAPASTSRLRVLVADDDPTVRRCLCRSLRRYHDVEEAADGAEVVTRVRDGERFDAVLMDLEMPRMDGRRALEALEATAPALADRTLIVTGGTRLPELAQWLGRLRPERVHWKPVDMDALVVCIDRLHEMRVPSPVGPR